MSEVRTGGAVWGWVDASMNRATSPSRPISTDVLVIGAGISGALMAFRLAQSGKRVVIVDREVPASGSTAASTAMLQFELDLPLHVLRHRIGTDCAERAWQRSASALQTLSRLIRQERFRCGFRSRSSIYLAGDAYDGASLREEIEARHAAGLPGELLDREAVRSAFQLDREAAIVTPGSAAVNPVQLTTSLLTVAGGRGTRLLAPLEVQRVDESPTRVRAMAADVNGETVTIEAEAAVYCTGYRVPPQIAWADHEINSTWAIAATAVPAPPEWVRTHVMWEGSDPYDYMRSLSSNQVIVGGRDERSSSAFGDRAKLQCKAAELLASLRAWLPAHRVRLTHAWAGAFGSSSTGLPFVGRLPGHRRVFSVHGFGGNGITHSMLAADLVTGELHGRADPDASLFAGLPSTPAGAITR